MHFFDFKLFIAYFHLIEYGLILMQSVMEAWTHHADPTLCLLSEDQLEAIRKEGVNKVMKEMIQKYLLPSSSKNGIKNVVIKEDNQYFEKMVRTQQKHRLTIE